MAVPQYGDYQRESSVTWFWTYVKDRVNESI